MYQRYWAGPPQQHNGNVPNTYIMSDMPNVYLPPPQQPRRWEYPIMETIQTPTGQYNVLPKEAFKKKKFNMNNTPNIQYIPYDVNYSRPGASTMEIKVNPNIPTQQNTRFPKTTLQSAQTGIAVMKPPALINTIQNNPHVPNTVEYSKTSVTPANPRNLQIQNNNNPTTSKVSANNKEFRQFSGRPEEKLFLLTGTVERAIHWHKLLPNALFYIEIIASVVTLQEGKIKTQKIMLLRDRVGPILQVVYYQLTHLAIENFHLGKMVRCVGRMAGSNIFNAVCIRDATDEEIEALSRLTLISDQAVGMHLKN
ncbi:unnamed protein product [Phyllotreta striolata]|uniref:Uncharacterized protein n=1 Tax=Phyllotreta striolata TaxID=444603 RepID=A0A9N9TW69_PHYSR|nr:unnamed protein product [Phyllotreta striolata]